MVHLPVNRENSSAIRRLQCALSMIRAEESREADGRKPQSLIQLQSFAEHHRLGRDLVAQGAMPSVVLRKKVEKSGPDCLDSQRIEIPVREARESTVPR